MKKIVCSITLVILICLCSACGNTNKISSRTKKVAEQMIAAVDQYLNFDIEAEEAEEKVTNLFTRLVKPDDTASQEEKDLYLYAMSLDNQMRYVSYQLIKKDSDGLAEAEENVLNARNRVAKVIGAKQR